MNFSVFKTAVQRQFLKMTKAGTLFRANISGDTLWETYLGAFPAGTNPLYRERTEYDCSCCRHFIKSIGGVLSIIDGKLDKTNRVVVASVGTHQLAETCLTSAIQSGVWQDLWIREQK